MVDATKNYKNNPSFTRDVVQFILTEKNVNPKAPEVSKLKNLLFSSASEIEPAAPDIIFEPLIITSPNAAYLDVSAVYQNVNPGDILRSFRSDNTPKVIAAKIKSGRADRPFELLPSAIPTFSTIRFGPVRSNCWTATLPCRSWTTVTLFLSTRKSERRRQPHRPARQIGQGQTI